MYSVQDLKRAIATPQLVARELNRLYYSRGGTRSYNTAGIDVFDRDWDALVILDACRYDTFEQYSDLPGELDSVISRGSSTPEFLVGNLDGRDLSDTVYVNANPQLARQGIDVAFHEVVNVWEDAGWDDQLGTVLPETMVEYTLEARESHPNKRLLVHFIQPHYPFVTADTEFDKQHLHDPDGKRNMWDKLLSGRLDVPAERVKELYEENLKVTLPHVRELLASLRGKTVVTSDHGNLFGERVRPVPIREWGHPHAIYVDSLVRVPWLVYTNERRIDIDEGSSSDVGKHEDTLVEERLENLGYK